MDSQAAQHPTDESPLIYPILVGIIADTHGHLPDEAFASLAECDSILHAGDIGDPAIIRSLEVLAPVTAVLGNNDFASYGDRVGRFAYPIIGGVRFLMAHTPHDAQIGRGGGPGLAPGDPIPQVCVHGHTHVPRIASGKEAWPAEYIICPGSPVSPRGGSKRSVAKIRIEGGRVVHAYIENLS